MIGHPPHRKEEPFTFEKISAYLSHRTFAGFTRKRKLRPKITLSVLGHTEEIEFGFPEFNSVDFDSFGSDGLMLDESKQTLFISINPKKSTSLSVNVKGFLTWRPEVYHLSKSNLNTGLILSVKGIPYFTLSMEEYGATSIRTARPGEERTCLVVECDGIQDEMNISRSGLVDSPRTIELKKLVSEIFERVESSEKYLSFSTTVS